MPEELKKKDMGLKPPKFVLSFLIHVYNMYSLKQVDPHDKFVVQGLYCEKKSFMLVKIMITVIMNFKMCGIITLQSVLAQMPLSTLCN